MAACQDCRFWVYDGETDSGQCRVGRPSLIVDESGAKWTGWPETKRRDWCGEHQPEYQSVSTTIRLNVKSAASLPVADERPITGLGADNRQPDRGVAFSGAETRTKG